MELLIGRWEFFRREFLHEEWFDETPCLYCGFLDIAGWRLAQIYILISGRRLAYLQEGSEFVCRIRLMNLFSARFAISACGQLQQYLQQWFYCNQCRCICNSYVFMYLLLYSWCNSYLQMSVFFHIYLFMVFCNGPQKGVWKFGPAIFIVSLVRTLRCVSCSFRAMTISQVFAAPTTMFSLFL